jgi:AMP-polyphosphate phosphotransferase
VSRLAEIDLTQKLKRKEQDERLEVAWLRLSQLRLTLGGQIGEQRIGPAVCILFEGWDAAGKGGAIKRLVAELDSRHVRVVQFSAPSHDEKRHQYLWRFWPVLPGKGGMAILDRSWYGRVLVERVEGYARDDEWQRAYDEINSFESSLVEDGTILIKFWLHISEEEQLRRFERRERKPLKAWKLTDEDWRNREKREQYEEAVEDMLERTDRPHAHWDVIAGESKRFARVSVIETVIARIEEGMERCGYPVPEPLQDD